MRLTSPTFQEGAFIPSRYSCEGENISPELSWQEAPKAAASFALICHDPDAPREHGFTHWLLFNILPKVDHIPENVPKQAQVSDLGLQGMNDAGAIGYTGPCPPSGTHRYYFRLYALKKELNLSPGASARDVEAALENNVIEQTELMGTYAKEKAKAQHV